MKLIIKNLKQVTYEVEVPSEKLTVLDLKKVIETAHNFDSTSLKLLLSGAVLDDTKTLEEYKITEGSYIIMMNTKVKVKNNQPQQSEQPQNQEKKEEKTNEKKEEKGEGEGEEGEEIDPIKKIASICKILCRENPSNLTNIMQNIQQSDPDLFNLINEREE